MIPTNKEGHPGADKHRMKRLIIKNYVIPETTGPNQTYCYTRICFSYIADLPQGIWHISLTICAQKNSLSKRNTPILQITRLGILK